MNAELTTQIFDRRGGMEKTSECMGQSSLDVKPIRLKSIVLEKGETPISRATSTYGEFIERLGCAKSIEALTIDKVYILRGDGLIDFRSFPNLLSLRINRIDADESDSRY